jgi:hypothetical protein
MELRNANRKIEIDLSAGAAQADVSLLKALLYFNPVVAISVHF